MSLPLAALTIAVSCVITCTLLSAVHRRASKDTFLGDTTRGAAIYGVVGTSFAVLLAFVVFVAFQSYDHAKAGAEIEADATLEEFRSAEFFPLPTRRDLQDTLVCYGRSVVDQDWPAMRDESRSEVTDKWSLALQNVFLAVRVVTPKEQVAFSNLLSLRDKRIDGRRQRLAEATPIITTPVWFFLGLAALLNIGFVLLFIDRRGESLVMQLVMMGCVTATIVSGLLLVWFLDHPFQDQTGGIRPAGMEQRLAVMQDEQAALRPPCDLEGNPS
jgi:hypothetical protein